MKIHEYQAKGILKKYGVTVPQGTMATSREEAEAAARELLARGRPQLWSRLKFMRAGAARGEA